MRTDDYGYEIMPVKAPKSPLFRGTRLFLIGLVGGVGLCFGMGPPLPLVDFIQGAAAADEQVPVHNLPQQWVVWRNALLDPSVTGVSVEEQQEAVQLLHRRWQVLVDTLHDMEAPQIASR